MDFFSIVGVTVSGLSFAYAVVLLVPGDEPDNTIKKILDLTKKLSVK